MQSNASSGKIILTQNEQKKVWYIYGLGPRDQKVQKTLKFHVFFPPFAPPRGGKGGKVPKMVIGHPLIANMRGLNNKKLNLKNFGWKLLFSNPLNCPHHVLLNDTTITQCNKIYAMFDCKMLIKLFWIFFDHWSRIWGQKFRIT